MFRSIGILAMLLGACGSGQTPAATDEPAPLLSNVEQPDAAAPVDVAMDVSLPALAADQWCAPIAEASVADYDYVYDTTRCPAAVELSGGGAPPYYFCKWDPEYELARERADALGEPQCCYRRNPNLCTLYPRSAK